MAQQRNRQAVEHENGGFRELWFTVETEDGNAVATADRVFDHRKQSDAEEALQRLVVEVGKPLSIVRYSRHVADTYQAVMRIEKVEPEKGEDNSK